jgi:hypothetical protein
MEEADQALQKKRRERFMATSAADGGIEQETRSTESDET